MHKDHTPAKRSPAKTRFVFFRDDIEAAFKQYAESQGHEIPAGACDFKYHPIRDRGCGQTNEMCSLTIVHG